MGAACWGCTAQLSESDQVETATAAAVQHTCCCWCHICWGYQGAGSVLCAALGCDMASEHTWLCVAEARQLLGALPVPDSPT